MKMVMLYRVEDNLGHGMYHSPKAPSLEMYDEIRHPEPKADSKLFAGVSFLFRREGTLEIDFSKFKYGFASLEQLKSWIYKDEWRKELHETGFKLSIYECEDEYFVAGDTQAVVLLNTYMELIECKSLLEI